MGKEEAKERIQTELDFAIAESKNKRNSEDIKMAYDYKRDAYEIALQIIEKEIEEDQNMPIEIFLALYDKLGTKPTDTEVLEDLEDSIRDLLLSKGFGEFTIEDSYTGNTVNPVASHGGAWRGRLR